MGPKAGSCLGYVGTLLHQSHKEGQMGTKERIRIEGEWVLDYNTCAELE